MDGAEFQDTHRMIRPLMTVALFVAIGLGLPVAGWADGDDFFRAGEIIGDTQLVFVGTVKDDRGNYIEAATVRWQATMTDDDGDHHVGFETYTNAVGRYRTVNVMRAVVAADFEFDAGKIDVTAWKPGYSLVRRLRRGRAERTSGVVEVNFTLAKTDAAPR